ncbi:MAG: preprotein translocase subunit YajC [Clostridia bacterium]|nr:preprotein translocase subunit YajC [Clostridia bacterium]MBQ4298470.1 preprotein translocase subunit YajC [Clostridia bacterium]
MQLVSTLLMLGLILVVFYFFVIRPQKKQEKEAQDMRNSLQIGDEVTTIGGIIGKIISIKDETFMLETGKDKTRIRFLKSAVRSVDVKAEDTIDAERAAQKAAEKEAAKTETEEK